MDANLVLNVLALAISTVALAVSGAAANRQLRIAQNSNLIPVIADLFRETRSSDFLTSVEFIRDRLATAHPGNPAYRELPEDARGHIRRVGLFYDDIGKLVAHGVVDESLILGAYGGAVPRMWELVAPYVLTERQKYGTTPMAYFEDLAARAQIRTMGGVHQALALRGYAPPRA
ncbi:hypothetical protein ACFY5F_29520 [Streptomyces sp. NPDC013161]|uniref:DUF4760 domain-containing protein n=1 Tax=Streptomyces sp. NPDC013161 TaxID=3364862 RepID=UPI0036A2E78A